MLELLRKGRVLASRGCGKSKHDDDVRARLFTKPVKPDASGCAFWPAHEVSALNAAIIAGKSRDEIRAIVVQLEALRSEVAGMSGDELRALVARLVAGKRP